MRILLVLLFGMYILAVGFLFIKTFFNKISLNSFTLIGLSWMLGLGAISLQMLLYNWLHIPWHPGILAIPWIILVGIYFKKFSLKVPSLKKIDSLILLVFLILAIILVGQTIYMPVFDLDGWSIWNFKAQVFYITQDIPLSFLQNKHFPLTHMDYPLLLPLVQTWVYQHLGRIDTGISKFIYPFSYFSMLCFFYGSLITFHKKVIIPFILTLFLALSPAVTFNYQLNYADLLLAHYLLGAVSLVYLAVELKNSRYYFLASLLMGFAAFTKNEGQVLFILFGVWVLIQTFFLRRSALKPVFYSLILGSFMWLPWALFSRHYSLSPENWGAHLNWSFLRTHTDQVGIILTRLKQITVQRVNSTYGITWMLGCFLIVVHLLGSNRKILWWYTFLLLSLATYCFFYYITPMPLYWHLGSSFNRLILHLYIPLMWLISVSILEWGEESHF